MQNRDTSAAEAKALELALTKWEAVKVGESNVIVDDYTLALLSTHFQDDDSVEASVYFSHTSSPMNPNQVGTRDPYILTLSAKGRDILETEPTSGMSP